jgi:hypothetical protein
MTEKYDFLRLAGVGHLKIVDRQVVHRLLMTVEGDDVEVE